jgi:hypothetical protein
MGAASKVIIPRDPSGPFLRHYFLTNFLVHLIDTLLSNILSPFKPKETYQSISVIVRPLAVPITPKQVHPVFFIPFNLHILTTETLGGKKLL